MGCFFMAMFLCSVRECAAGRDEEQSAPRIFFDQAILFRLQFNCKSRNLALAMGCFFMAMFLCSTLLQMTYFAVHTLDSIFYKTDYFGIFLRRSTIANNNAVLAMHR